MRYPVQNLAGSRDFGPIRYGRTVDHDDGKPKRPGGSNFGVSSSAACVFGNDDVDQMISHQGLIVGLGERATRHENLRSRQGQDSFRGVHQTQQIEVLRIGCELCQMHATHRQHNAQGGAVQCGDGTCDVGNMAPHVTWFRLPGRTGQGDQRDTRLRAGGDRITAHLGRERMRGVYEVSDGMDAQIGSKARNTTKPTNTLGQRLAHGALHPTREGNGAADARVGQHACQCCGFSGATKDQKVRYHV